MTTSSRVFGQGSNDKVGKASNTTPEFLSQPYTMRDVALKELETKAEDWTKRVVEGGSFSSLETASGLTPTEVVTPPAVDTLGRIIVSVAYTVDSIIGNAPEVCKTHVGFAANDILGLGMKDVYGNEVRKRNMLEMFGPAAARDTTAAKRAADYLYKHTVVRLRIIETDNRTAHSCIETASGQKKAYKTASS